MTKKQFEREIVYKADGVDSRTVSFVVNVYQDKLDKEKIWVVSNKFLTQLR